MNRSNKYEININNFNVTISLQLQSISLILVPNLFYSCLLVDQKHQQILYKIYLLFVIALKFSSSFNPIENSFLSLFIYIYINQ
jgi:hypothetical protein